jgi:hypothetical protein
LIKVLTVICLSICLTITPFSISKNNNLEKIKYGGITRTLHLLKTSNKRNQNEISILFYGQSIIGNLNSDILIKSLKKSFPYAKITHKNKAIGGFTIPSLIKTAEHDLYGENPDLIIFHGYDGIDDGLLDSLVYNIRSRLNSDILLFDHHYVWDKPKSKLELINKSHDFDSNQIKNVAKKYDCGFVNVREKWRNYLDSNNIGPNELIGNTVDANVHPNEKGNKLLRKILISAFKSNNNINYNFENDALREKVTLEKSFRKYSINFQGNRLILETNKRYNKGSKIEVLINDKRPSEIKSNYCITRPSVGYNTWMPAVKKISFGHTFPVKEAWKIKIFDIDRTKKTFKFRLAGSLAGFDGEGSSKSNFVSNSGRISIKKEDWNIFEIEKITKDITPEYFEINFNIDLLVDDTLKLEKRTSKYLLFRGNYTENLKLELKVVNGNPDLEKIKIFRPYIDIEKK